MNLPVLLYLLKCAMTSLTFLYSHAASDTQMNKGDLFITFIKDNTGIFLDCYHRNSASSVQLYISSEADLQLGKQNLMLLLV